MLAPRTLFLPLALALAAGCASSVDTSDGGRDATPDATGQDGAADAPAGDAAVQCNASPQVFPSFDHTCSSVSDCIIVVHQTDCCGTRQATGLRASEGPRFAAAEQVCEAQYPGCGCASRGIQTEGGMAAVDSVSAVAVRCEEGLCLTSPREATPCGSTTCSPTQTCVPGCCGVPGCTPPPSQCVDVPESCASAPGCGCFPSNPCATGSCEGYSGGQVTCVCA